MKKIKINLMNETILSLKKLIGRRDFGEEYCARVAGEDLGYYAGLLQGGGREKLEYLTEVLVHEFVCNVAEEKREAEVFRLGARSVLEFLEECMRVTREQKLEEKEGKKSRKIVPFF